MSKELRRRIARPLDARAEARHDEAGDKQPALPGGVAGDEAPRAEVGKRERDCNGVEHQVANELDDPHAPEVETPFEARLCRRPQHVDRHHEEKGSE